MCLVSLALLSGSPGFPAFLLGFLGHYRLSSTSSTAVHFYPLSCSPLGSFPCFSSSSTPFRVFFCLPRLPGGFALALLSFISSFEFFRFRCPFSWCCYLCLVHLYSCYFSCSPLSSLAVPVDHLRVSLLFIFLYCLLISHLSLAILFMAPRPLCLRSFLIIVAFPPVVPPGWSPSSFSLLVHQVLIPSILLSFGSVCPALVPSSFQLPSYLAAASQVVLSPWLTLMQFMALLPLVKLSISIGCWLLLVNFNSLLFGSSFYYRIC